MSEAKNATRINGNSLAAKWPQKQISTAYVQAMNNYGLMEDFQTDDRYVSLGTNANFGVNNLTYRFGKNEHLLSNIAVVFGITYAGTTQGIKSDYLAYRMIKNLRVQLSSLQPWNLAGHSLLHMSLQQCCSVEKRRKLLEASGTFVANDVASGLQNQTLYYVAHIPIYGSSLKMRSYDSVKPLPLHMIKADNLELSFDIEQADNLFNAPLTPTLTSASIYYQYAKALNSDMLMRPIGYKYPFTYTTSASKPLANAASQTIDITGFRRAECTHIIWYVVSKTQNDASNIFAGVEDVKNIEWIFNGDQIREEQNLNSKVFDLYDNKLENRHAEREILLQGGDVTHNFIHRGQAGEDKITNISVFGSPIVAGYEKKYYHVLKLADLLKDSQTNATNNYVNGCDFSKQSLQLNFDSAKVNAANGGTIYYTLCYNSLINFNEEGLLQGF